MTTQSDASVLPPEPNLSRRVWLGRLIPWLLTGLGLASLGIGAWLRASLDRGRLVVESPRRRLAGVEENQTVPIRFPIRNTSGHLIRIVGSNDRCGDSGCSLTKGLPLAIPPGGTRTLEVDFKVRLSPFFFELILPTDDPHLPEVVLQFEG